MRQAVATGKGTSQRISVRLSGRDTLYRGRLHHSRWMRLWGLLPLVMLFLALRPPSGSSRGDWKGAVAHAGRDTGRLPTVRIGGQEWMAENLSVVTYRNGDTIRELRGAGDWLQTGQGAWCHYDNDSLNDRVYGKLYNWKAVRDPRGLCPAGWHVATDEDWSRLVEQLGGADLAGGRLKAAVYWEPPNLVVPEGSGFGARPGGYRYDNGFSYAGSHGYWWSRTEEDSSFAWSRVLVNRELSVTRISYDKLMGLSVRCVRD